MTDYKKELEEFAYIVSHDLNAPLRHVREFGKLLFKKLDNKVTDEERTYLAHMENGVQKTEAMLEALLAYSQINTQGHVFTVFDCHVLVTSIISHFQRDIDEADAKVNVSGLPEHFNGDETQIRKLFSCLLDNALKFRQSDTQPVIEISAEQRDDTWYFSVTDNGIGIPEQQRETVLQIFKRLNLEKYSGIGSGLAIARKIVERHGGEIWIESQNTSLTAVKFTMSAHPEPLEKI